MKKIYENPVIEITEFEREDILTASSGGKTDPERVSEKLAAEGRTNVYTASWNDMDFCN